MNQKNKTVIFKSTPWTEEAPPEFTNIERAILQLANEKFQNLYIYTLKYYK